LAGVAAAIWGIALLRRGEPQAAAPGGRRTLWILLAVPAGLVLLQFLALAAGKPGEYGRFAIFPDIVLGIAAITAAARAMRSGAARALVISMLVLATVKAGLAYEQGFLRDTLPYTSRLKAAARIQMLVDEGRTRVATWAEPAPYEMPPVDLFRTRLLLLPVDYEPKPRQWPAGVIVRAEDAVPAQALGWAAGAERLSTQDGRPARISWADKPIVIYAAPAAQP
jgi:hypothetical protein